MSFSNLTSREKEVSKLIADGFSYKEVASELDISIYTVKAHMHHIYNKLSSEGEPANKVGIEIMINKQKKET